jgi:hypothetical protein
MSSKIRNATSDPTRLPAVFGYNPAAFEMVTLSHFLKGRVDINHVVWPAVARFCIAATEFDTYSMAELRHLFFEGAKSHANNLKRATRGRAPIGIFYR